MLALAAVKAYLEAWLGAATSGETFNFVRAAYAVLVNFGIAVGAYFGLLQGTAVQQAAIRSGPVKDRAIGA